jgi:hypothetical protein
MRHRCYFIVKYDDNRLNGSKVIALCSVAAILNFVIWPYLNLYLCPICVGVFTHLWGRMRWKEWGGVIITKFCTRVHECYVMMSAIFGVDFSRDVYSDICKGLKIKISHLLGVLALQLRTNNKVDKQKLCIFKDSMP